MSAESPNLDAVDLVKMGKYCIRAIRIPSVNGEWTWLARAPYAGWHIFGSWEEAAVYLVLERRRRAARAMAELRVYASTL